jgi:plastocyanin
MTHPRRALALTLVALALPASAYAATRTVDVKDDFFSKKSLTITKGATVRWVWKGKAPHNVTVAKGPVKFHSPVKTSGGYKHVFKKRGTYKLLCTIHAPDMRMTITVR